jgi:putative ABC transport system permease protein
VLLIACSNIANLLLASGTARQREMAVRAALGAGRGRLVRQLLTESLILSVAGAAGGLLVAVAATRALVALGGGAIPRASEISLDPTVLLFTLATAVATSLLFGLAPALQTSGAGASRALADGARGQSAGPSRRATRNVLIVAEVSLSLVLLVGAGLLIRSLRLLERVDPGFRPEQVLTLQVSLPLARYAEGDQIPFYRQLLERLDAIPGVSSLGAINILPLSGNYSCDAFQVDDRPVPEGQLQCAEARSVTPGYFEAMSIPLLEGRGLTERDGTDSPGVVVINEAMARRYWPDGAVGRRLTYNRSLPRDVQKRVGGPGSREIVGVVGNVKHLGLQEEALPMFYTPHTQQPSYHTMALAVRTPLSGADLAPAVRGELSAMDAEIPLYNVRTMTGLLSGVVEAPRFRTMLLSGFAGLALSLALVGVYGVVAYSVSQRTREIGIRIALGASRREVVGILLAQSLLPVGIGIWVGLAGAVAMSRVLATMLYGVTPTDAATFLAVPMILAAAAAAASYVPARRALRIDPVEALRAD